LNFYTHETYGERVAGVYDDWYTEYDPHAVDALAEIASGGRVLELGIGTGRIALPLSAKGVNVHGIDAAESMISRLRSKPGGEKITIAPGNFAEVAVEGKFALVYIVSTRSSRSRRRKSRCSVSVMSRRISTPVVVSSSKRLFLT
jgi:2-polyprenyl-3-methyl-5-hydroxy-6-metoxy-1,4-benzoquinol methylase